MKHVILLSLIANLAIAQSGAVYETYKTRSGDTNESHGTIFNKPFQEYNYVKTARGIEVYQTYKTGGGNGTNQSHGTIFNKPFPEYYIVGNNVYRTYKTDYKSTNQSHGTIFAQPFQSKEIKANALKDNIRTQVKTQNSYSKNNGPTYDGETYNSGDGE
jgi:uncharacterized C2H2 Zn-finger protein